MVILHDITVVLLLNIDIKMVTLMVHSSPKCLDACIIYHVIDIVIMDLEMRLNMKVEFVVTAAICNIDFIISEYCKQRGITFNIIDLNADIALNAMSEIKLQDSIMLAIPFVVARGQDLTMKSIDKFLSKHIRTIVLHDYDITTYDNVRNNIMYYNF
jgi:hypothetical protein